MNIDGTLTLVTGASGGIGQAIARALSGRGARVVLTGRRRDVLETVAHELNGARVDVCDLTVPEDAVSLGSRLRDADILVCNAALPATGELADFSPAEIVRAVTVNLTAPMLLARQLVPAMIDRGRGHVVFISSMGGKVAPPKLSVYAATKFGMRGFAASLRQDLRGTGVSASVVFPGSITDAGMLADAGLPASPGTKGLRADDVAAGVVRAIEEDKAEVDVAPAVVRVAGRLAGVFPGVLARVAGTKDARAYADQLAEGLRHLR